ncbi:TPA: hypothetical protein DCZ31_03470 [Patescibacteria group bacterium]|nr:hypothetical protein [Candidatus Gracilibacteria bacterium]
MFRSILDSFKAWLYHFISHLIKSAEFTLVRSALFVTITGKFIITTHIAITHTLAIFWKNLSSWKYIFHITTPQNIDSILFKAVITEAGPNINHILLNAHPSHQNTQNFIYFLSYTLFKTSNLSLFLSIKAKLQIYKTKLVIIFNNSVEA